MSKKPQKQGKRGNSLHNYFPSNNHQAHKNQQQTIPKNQPRKRLCPLPPQQPRNSPSPPASPKKHTIHSLAKTQSIDAVLEKCPKLAELLAFIEQAVALPSRIAKGLLHKYLVGSVRALWSSKYSPNESSELFNPKAGHKIRDWLSAFFQYKNKISEQSDSFLNDFSEEPSCKAYQNIRENQWLLLALVVRGRPGTGKSSAVRAVAREMGIDLQECGNHYNQTKYLKEKNESTQSESVKTAISRKVRLEKNAQMITKFMAPVEREKASENRKGQMIHNVGEVFPEAEANKFYNELSRCVELSKIPFIMTDSCDRLPKECERYDVIQYECGENERIEQVLWAIYHIEHILTINNLEEIKEEDLFETINQQTASVQPKQIVPIYKIREVCALFNYRLDYIFTFLQQHSLETINLRPLFIEKYKNYTQQTFLQEISLLAFQQNGSLEDTKPEKPEDTALTTQDSEENEKGRQLSFEEHLRRLKIARVEENMSGLQESEQLFVGEWEQDSQNCIPIRIHRAVKQRLLAKVNLEINSVSEKFKSSLRLSQLQHLPMLIKEKRASRNAKASDDLFLKFFTENQCIYLKQFAHLIKNQ